MPRRTDRDLSSVSVTIESVEGGPFDVGTPSDHPLPGGFGLIVPEFVASIDDPQLPWLVRMVVGVHDGRLVARQVSVISRRPTGPVTGAALRRVPVDAYLGLARTEAARPEAGVIVAFDETPAGVRWSAGLSEQEWQESFDGRRRAQDQWLPSVALAYREALSNPTPRVNGSPTAEVARRLHMSRGHASRLVTAARRANLLGPASPGRAGEKPKERRAK